MPQAELEPPSLLALNSDRPGEGKPTVRMTRAY